MSYGREPYYIYSDGKKVSFHTPYKPEESAHVDEDAIAQLIASIVWRGPSELNKWVKRGYKLRKIALGKCPKITWKENK